MNSIDIKLIKLNNIGEEMYPSLVTRLVREKYSLSAELAVLRQRDSKPEAFAEYNEYVESCKDFLKTELNIRKR